MKKLKDIGFNLVALIGTLIILGISLLGIARGVWILLKASPDTHTGAPQDAGTL